MKLDLTVNVPTMVTLLAFVVSSVTAGVRIYNDLDARLTRASYDIAALQTRAQSAEAALAAVKTEQNAQMQTLRAEIRADLTEIKGSINSLLFSRNPSLAQGR